MLSATSTVIKCPPIAHAAFHQQKAFHQCTQLSISTVARGGNTRAALPNLAVLAGLSESVMGWERQKGKRWGKMERGKEEPGFWRWWGDMDQWHMPDPIHSFSKLPIPLLSLGIEHWKVVVYGSQAKVLEYHCHTAIVARFSVYV